MECGGRSEWSGCAVRGALSGATSGEGGEGGEQLRRGVYRDKRHRRLNAELIDLWLALSSVITASTECARGSTACLLMGGR